VSTLALAAFGGISFLVFPAASGRLTVQPLAAQSELLFFQGMFIDSVKSSADTTKPAPQTQKPGRLSRRAKALLRRQGIEGPEQMGDTSLGRPTQRVVPVDSTARLSQFLHLRKDYPMVSAERRNPHPLYTFGIRSPFGSSNPLIRRNGYIDSGKPLAEST